MDRTTFSIILTVYQREDLLAHALYCLQQQTYEHFEVIPVLHGENQRAATMLQSLRAQDEKMASRLKSPVVCNPPAETHGNPLRRMGMRWANHNYIIWLGHDCLVDKDFLAVHDQNISSAKGTAVISLVGQQHWRLVTNGSRLQEFGEPTVKEAVIYLGVLPRSVIGCGSLDLLNMAVPTVIARQHAFRPEDDYVYAADWRVFERLAQIMPVVRTRQIVCGHF